MDPSVRWDDGKVDQSFRYSIGLMVRYNNTRLKSASTCAR